MNGAAEQDTIAFKVRWFPARVELHQGAGQVLRAGFLNAAWSHVEKCAEGGINPKFDDHGEDAQ